MYRYRKRIKLKRTVVDIVNLSKCVIFTLKPEADKKQIKLKTLFQDPLPHVYVDADRITQVFINLIGNALKFTPENGQITVQIQDTPKAVECSVTDTGMGIASENMNKLLSK